jgi:predicted transcriptional regulator
MLNFTVASATESSRNSVLREALQAYERRFGSPPEWLEDLSSGRILSLVQQALQRGVPLIAAEVLH